jgi:hypothetical protein
MRHWELRCKHCGRIYTYPSDGSSQEYCTECQTAIDTALSKIPKKITKVLDYLTNKAECLRLDSVFDIEKTKYERSQLWERFPRIIPIVGPWGYKTVERCYINKVEYYRCTKEDGTFDIKVAKEFDLIKNEYTGNLYIETDKNNGNEYVPVEQLKSFVAEDITPKPMPLPQGDLKYLSIVF